MKKELKNHKINCICGVCKAIRGETKGVNCSRYNHGNNCSNKIYYCIVKSCNNKVFAGRNRCRSCANKIRNLGRKRPDQRKRMLGKNNPNYKENSIYFPYPKEFNDKLKEQIRKRDSYTCRECNTLEEEHLIIYGRKLEVHHIDYNKNNCNEENLITICKQCNMKANYDREYWKKRYRRKNFNIGKK
ncbi:hypothetical protein LCGC14_2862300 [marine sediment metagenome]|uniref:HNH nuclease domain-containing protein n=1 Tax=marine sediment metagenome TaxID=412755 RepID=A0A0F8YS15_9ZZZZ